MAGTTPTLSRGQKRALGGGLFLLLAAFGGHSWPMGLIAVALLGGVGYLVYKKYVELNTTLEPWPWPAAMRAKAEAMARPIDPTPNRVLPPDDKAAMVARVASTKEELAKLIAEKPPAWPWAVFTSVALQRRNAVAARLRAVTFGYQPRPGMPLSGQAYSRIVHQALTTTADIVAQLEGFMLSPAFKGAFGDERGDRSADADAVVSVANRLMDYHESLLIDAETCLQTPVNPEARVFVQDTGAFVLLPLLGYDQFITTMCTRIGEAQDLLPYAHGGDVQLDDVNLSIVLPEGLMDRILAHIKRFNS